MILDRYATPAPRLDRATQAKVDAHDDYLAATKAMQERQKTMSVLAQHGDEFARGWVAAMSEFAGAVQTQLARRIGA